MYGSLFYVLPILAVIAKTVFRAVLPLLIGCMIAYVVNILMCFYEKGYARICRMAAIAPLQRPLCMTLSYLSLVLVILIDLMVDDRPSAVILHPDHRNRFPPGFRITV